MNSINFYPVSFGYGPLSTAAYIAQAIRNMVGNDVKINLVINDDDTRVFPKELLHWFDNISALTDKPFANIHVTIMNRSAVEFLYRENERVFIVDVLSWLWNKPYDSAKHAERYYYQKISWLSGSDDNIELPPNAMPVNPIVRPYVDCAEYRYALTTFSSSRPLISLGGIDTTQEDTQCRYMKLLFSGYLNSEMRSRPILFGNRQIIMNNVQGLFECDDDKNLLFAYAHQFGGLLCAAGLTTVLECLASGIPFGLLPPQNYSQARLSFILHKYGVPRLTWESPLCKYAESHVLEEELGIRFINSCINSQFDAGHCCKNEQIEKLWRDVHTCEVSHELYADPYNGAEYMAKELLGAL